MLAIQLKTGMVAPPEAQLSLLALVNIVLRFMTKQPVALWAFGLLTATLLLTSCSHVVFQPPPVTGEGLVSFTARDATNAGDDFKLAGYTTESQCMYDVATQLTAASNPGLTFAISGLLSGGAVGYIDAKALLAGLGASGQLSPSCLQTVGNVVMSIAMFKAFKLPSATPGK